MRHIMVDLETLGRRAGCKILSIGAAEFGACSEGRTFSVAVYREGQGSLHEDADTVAWWSRQSDAAQAAAFADPAAKPLLNALADFRGFLESLDEPYCVWGNGSDFDNAILHAAFAECGIPTPWDHWNNRCYRTLKSLAPDVKLVRVGTFHNALDDARSQAAHADAILAKLGLVL